jgi:hypothetical protein
MDNRCHVSLSTKQHGLGMGRIENIRVFLALTPVFTNLFESTTYINNGSENRD